MSFNAHLLQKHSKVRRPHGDRELAHQRGGAEATCKAIVLVLAHRDKERVNEDNVLK